MTRILIRAHKDPFRIAGPEETIREDLLGNNTGNLVFSQAVCRLLSTRDSAVRTSQLRPGHVVRSGRYEGARIDRLVLPLANAFRPRYGKRLDRLTAIIEAAGVPVTVLGVGAQADLDGRLERTDDTAQAVTRFIRAALQHGTGPIGVRGEFTRDYLRDLGFGDQDVTIIGCPSMFMYGPNLRVGTQAEELTATSPIALNISPYVAAMGPISRRHAERYPNLVYIAQNEQSLEFLLTGRYPAKPSSPTFTSGVPATLEHPLVRQDRIRFFLDPSTWIQHLAGYDFSFGTRIHGNIAALLAGTPAMVLTHDARTLELAEYHQIPHRMITEDPDRIDAAELYAGADWKPLMRGHAGRWKTFVGFLDQHGLATVYADGEDRGMGFDRELAAMNFPGPVRTPIKASPEELFAMRRELRELRDRVAQLESQGALATQSVAPLLGRLDRPRRSIRRAIDRLRPDNG